MWTDPHHVSQWWGPDGFTTTMSQMDVRPGGVWTFTLHGPDGRDYANKSVFIDVVPPERLEYDHISGPLFKGVVNFTDRGARSEVSVRMIFQNAELRDKAAKEFGAAEGLVQMLDRLQQHIIAVSPQPPC